MEESCQAGYSGGEELRRAMAALAGTSGDGDAPQEQPTSPQPAHLPIRLTGREEAGVRELAFAAQRYSRQAARDPADFEAAYNHGLALQELALKATTSRQEQLHLLQQAAGRYEAAWRLRPASHAALYNWGVALSDMARVTKAADPREAAAYLSQAAEKYALSLRWNPAQPQALNNWGLVLQELAASGAPAEQAGRVRASVGKFRQAVRLRPDFDRACYNLGTVFYALACTQQAALSQQLPSHITQDQGREADERRQGAAAKATFAAAAQYIVLAHALQPSKEVYRNSLRLVQPLLPLPHLRAGWLLAQAPLPEPRSIAERWERTWFVLDEEGFRSAPPPADGDGAAAEPAEPPGAQEQQQQHSISLREVTAATTCLDPSLPAGGAFWLRVGDRPAGLHFVAETAEEAEGWVDALLLGAHCASLGRLAALRRALQVVLAPPAAPEPAPQQPAPPQQQKQRQRADRRSA